MSRPRLLSQQEANLPKLVYKYRHLSKLSEAEDLHKIESILNGEFWASHPRRLNDPFDCTPRFVLSDGRGKWERYRDYLRVFLAGQTEDDIDRYVRKHSLEMASKHLLEVTLNRTGIISLAEETQYNPLMWSHYASSHTGVCIGIDPLSFQDEVAYTVHRVLYSLDRPQIVFPPDKPRHNGLFPLADMYLIKPVCWSYEKEWRILTFKPDSVISFPEHLVRQLVLGANISEEHEDHLITFCERRKEPLGVFKAFLSEDQYGLKYARIL